MNLIDTCTQSRCELIDVGTADRVVETILNHAEVRAQLGNAVDEGGDPVFLRGRVGAPAELLEPGAELGRERRQLGAGDGLLGLRAKLLDGPDKRSETLVVPGRLHQGTNLVQPRTELRRETFDLGSVDQVLQPSLQPVELVALDRAIRTRRQLIDHATQLGERALDRRRLHQRANVVQPRAELDLELGDLRTARQTFQPRPEVLDGSDERGDPLVLDGRSDPETELLEPGAQLGGEGVDVRALGGGAGETLERIDPRSELGDRGGDRVRRAVVCRRAASSSRAAISETDDASSSRVGRASSSALIRARSRSASSAAPRRSSRPWASASSSARSTAVAILPSRALSRSCSPSPSACIPSMRSESEPRRSERPWRAA